MRVRNLVFLCLFGFVKAVTHGDLIKDEWEAFKFRFNKKFEDEFEERKRMDIFARNRHEIAEHNELFENGVESYAMAVNEFADTTHEEFQKTMAMHALNLTEAFIEDEEEAVSFIPPPGVTYVPSYIDWRKKGAVTKVKNQMLCGACWAFSATGALEGQHYRKTRRLVSLSEQNLIDCSSAYGNKGCGGGLPSNAFKYIKQNRGVDTERSYPYKANQGFCREHCSEVWKVYFDERSKEKGIWYRTIQPQPWGSPWFDNCSLNRQDLITAFRLRSRHIPLNKFAFLMRKVPSPNCSECGVIEDVYHALVEYNPRHSGAKDKGFISIPKSEYKLKKAVATKGPVSVVVDSRHMKFYSHGIYYYKHCSNQPLSLDHAVLVVGYGHIKHGGDYWLIKNSWGTTWGSKGYMKLARNRKNHCGVATLATVPLV